MPEVIPKPGELWGLRYDNPVTNYFFKRQTMVLILSVNVVEEDMVEYLTSDIQKRRWLTEEFVKHYRLYARSSS